MSALPDLTPPGTAASIGGRRPVLFAMVAYSALLAVQLAWAYRCFSQPDEMIHGTAVMVHHAANFMRGEDIYRDFRAPPHAAAVYGPLVYAIPAWIGRASDADVFDLYRIGRAMSLLATLGTAALVYALTRRLGAGAALSVVATLATVSCPIYWTVSGEYRADPVAVFLSLAAIWWFVRFQSRRWWLLAVVPIVAAFLFKQSSILPLPSIALYLWYCGRRWASVVFGGLTAVVLCGLVAGVNAGTDGAFWQNTVHALRGNRSPANLLAWPIAVLPVAVAQYGLAACWLARCRRARGLGPVEFYAVVALVVALAMTWRDGSVEYYFCESVAAASILMALQWQRWRNEPAAEDFWQPLRMVATVLPALVAIVAIAKLDPSPNERYSVFRDIASHRDEEREVFDVMLRRYDRLDPPVLCDLDSITLAGRHRPTMMDIWLFSGMIDQGAFDDTAIRAGLEAGRFGGVILREPVEQRRRYQSTYYVPTAWRQLIAERYRLAERFGTGFYVYLPND